MTSAVVDNAVLQPEGARQVALERTASLLRCHTTCRRALGQLEPLLQIRAIQWQRAVVWHATHVEIRRLKQALLARQWLQCVAAVGVVERVEQRRRRQQTVEVGHAYRIAKQLDRRPARQQSDRAPIIHVEFITNREDRCALGMRYVQAHCNLGHARSTHHVLAAWALVHLHVEPAAVIHAAQQAEHANALEAVVDAAKRQIVRIAPRSSWRMPVRVVRVRAVRVRAVRVRHWRRVRWHRWRRRWVALTHLDHRRDATHVARTLGRRASHAKDARRVRWWRRCKRRRGRRWR